MSNLLHKVEQFLIEARKKVGPVPQDIEEHNRGFKTSTGYTAYRCMDADRINDLIQDTTYAWWHFSNSQPSYEISASHGKGLFYVFLRDDYFTWFRNGFYSSERSNYEKSMIAVSFRVSGIVDSIYYRNNGTNSGNAHNISKLENILGVRLMDLYTVRKPELIPLHYDISPDGVLEACIDHRLTEAIIPQNVTEIGSWAFSCHPQLTKVVMHDKVKKIGERSFNYCSNLESVRFSKGLKEIPNGAFYSCEKLKVVSIPNKVTEIGESSFVSCTSLCDLGIPSSVKNIGMYSFYNCRSLKRVVIPSSVETIGKSSFSSCSKNLYLSISRKTECLGSIVFTSNDEHDCSSCIHYRD